MPDLILTSFRPALPRIGDRALDPHAASRCWNADVSSTELRGLRAPVIWRADSGEDAMSYARLTNASTGEEAWTEFDDPRGTVVRSTVVEDFRHRWYKFEPDTDPRVLTFEDAKIGVQGYKLAVGGPTLAPTLAVASAGTASLSEDRVYCYSFVTSWGEESDFSPTTTLKNIKTDGTVTIGFFDTGQDLEGSSIYPRYYRYIRVYRSVVGNSSAAFRFVADVDWGTASWVDTKTNTEVSLNDQMPPRNTAPVSGLMGVRAHPSGALVAFKDRTVYFSRPYLPHAWPTEWQMSITDPIVRLEIIQDQVLVITKGHQVVLYGQSPSFIGKQVSPYPTPGLSYNSVVATRAGIFYPTEDGLMLVTAGGAKVVSEPVMTRKNWRKLCYDPDLRAIGDENKYIAWRADGTGFIFEVDGGGMTFQELRGLGIDVVPYMDTATGLPGLIHDGAVFHWDHEDGEEIDFKWRSKEFYLPEPEDFQALQVEFEPRSRAYDYPYSVLTDEFEFTGSIDRARQVVVTLWADGEIFDTRAVYNREQVLLRAGTKHTIWQIQVEGQCRVHRVTLTTAAKRLKGV